MGCDESITMEDRPITMKTPQQQSQGATTRPLTIEKKMTGLLEKDLHFQDCLIQSENDLENKIRMFIPTKKPDENNPEQLVPNIQDDIVTNSIQVDFDKCCVIAMSAINITNKSEMSMFTKNNFYNPNLFSCMEYDKIFEEIQNRKNLFQLIIPPPCSFNASFCKKN